jgi:hypothetical protein
LAASDCPFLGRALAQTANAQKKAQQSTFTRRILPTRVHLSFRLALYSSTLILGDADISAHDSKPVEGPEAFLRCQGSCRKPLPYETNFTRITITKRAKYLAFCAKWFLEQFNSSVGPGFGGELTLRPPRETPLWTRDMKG